VVDPFGLEEEIRELTDRGLLKGELILSERATVLLPIHRAEDRWEEELRSGLSKSASLGTTGKGIGPAYADRYGRWALRMADLTRPQLLAQRLELVYSAKKYLPDLPAKEELERQLAEVGGRLAPYTRATEPLLWTAIANGETVLLEGAQSALLDIDFGTYPYVTSSHPTSAGALVGSGIPPTELTEVVGVAKAYATRVGAGPFPTLLSGDEGAHLRRAGDEHGATTGRPRDVGWLDLVLLRYVARLNGFTSLAITKVDVLGGLDEVPVCLQYVVPDGTTLTDYPPAVAEEFARVQPVYQKLPGWPKFTEGLKEKIRSEGARALPSTLRRFLDFITQETRVPVEYLSFGPAREDTVWLGVGARAPRRGITAWTGS
jgi:adenylosuccinate synthase